MSRLFARSHRVRARHRLRGRRGFAAVTAKTCSAVTYNSSDDSSCVYLPDAMVISVCYIKIPFLVEGQTCRYFQACFGCFATVAAVTRLTSPCEAGNIPSGVHSTDNVVIAHGDKNIPFFINGNSIDQGNFGICSFDHFCCSRYGKREG